MRSYGIDMIGRFVLERVNSLPVYESARDKGRLVYDLSVNQIYFGTNTQWKSVSPDYATMQDLQDQIDSNDTDISNLESSVATNAGDISNLESSVATNASNISSNDTDISNLESSVATNASNISSNDTDISNLNSNLNGHINSRDEHPLVTTSQDGFMSSSDKSKLNGVDNNANKYSLETHSNAYHSENYITSADVPNTLEDLDDVYYNLTPEEGDALVFNDSVFGSDYWKTGLPQHQVISTIYNNNLHDLDDRYSYIVLAEIIEKNRGTGSSTLYRKTLKSSSGAILTYNTSDNHTIDWPDGNFPHMISFRLLSSDVPSDGYIQLTGGNIKLVLSMIAFPYGQYNY